MSEQSFEKEEIQINESQNEYRRDKEILSQKSSMSRERNTSQSSNENRQLDRKALDYNLQEYQNEHNRRRNLRSQESNNQNSINNSLEQPNKNNNPKMSPQSRNNKRSRSNDNNRYIYEYKTQKCRLSYCEDHHECFNYHNQSDHRRKPIFQDH